MLFHQPHNSMGNYNYNARFYKNEIWQHHFHKNLELIYVLSGQVGCEVNNKRYTLSKGDFGLCLPYDVHAYKPSENTEYYVLVFSADYVRLLGAYRLETAIKLIDETDKKIADIAYESGFGSVRSFNYTFKKHFGISPNEYRRKV